eukprot:CAMPEP_0114576398 /NCGR_PEP_ID=MMETSP0125-20121206/1172_1 /TAXON_ID=485358 ORGANISM="Aristerostoma sp., Strain ATCC 50986" /NCGR_SAMPLE_ID=MMETSP0125 /ASSEMBLY_ACC=CAM_ASM_000245 /LENGTH=80 /DNA_ID=CAMNT_0001764897 /DNA_START=1997 /DNA_END=2239 /DNA_ORIENTATION=-
MIRCECNQSGGVTYTVEIGKILSDDPTFEYEFSDDPDDEDGFDWSVLYGVGIICALAFAVYRLFKTYNEKKSYRYEQVEK